MKFSAYLGSGMDFENNFDPFWIQCCHGGFEKIKVLNFLKSDLTFFSLNDFFKTYENMYTSGFFRMMKITLALAKTDRLQNIL